MTTFLADGVPMVSANANASRSFLLLGVALNNISRIEVTKVPTPSSRADSLGGSINMISKSALERSHPQFRYGVSLVANSENLTLKRTPHSFDRMTRKVLPGFEFDYTLPVNKELGIVVTGMHSNK